MDLQLTLEQLAVRYPIYEAPLDPPIPLEQMLQLKASPKRCATCSHRKAPRHLASFETSERSSGQLQGHQVAIAEKAGETTALSRRDPTRAQVPDFYHPPRWLSIHLDLPDHQGE